MPAGYSLGEEGATARDAIECGCREDRIRQVTGCGATLSGALAHGRTLVEMTRPASYPTLPFDDPAGDDGAPVEVTIRVAQPSLLSARAGLETDVVHAIEASQWRAALDLLARLRLTATAPQAARMDEAVPVLEALASTASVGVEQAVTSIDAAAVKAPGNVWLRHVTASLVLHVLDRDGAAGLVWRLGAGALPHVYRVTAASMRPGLGLAPARTMLRDALTHGVPVSLAALGDRELDALDVSDLSPAWYPVLGAVERVWDVPKWKPSAGEVSAVLDGAVPDDDTGRARLFWQCYQVWKAQKAPNDVVARTRARMKQLHPGLFSRLV